MLQNLFSFTYQEMSNDIETQIANLDKDYEHLATEISKQGEEWHKEIDLVISKTKTEISEIKVKNKDILHKHLNEIKKKQSLIIQALHATKEIEESNEVSIAIEYNSENRELGKPPTEVKVSMPTFIPKPIYRERLYHLFGKITPSTAIKQNVLLLKKPPNILAKKLLDQPKLDVKIQTLHSMLSNVAYLDEKKVWTSGETGEIKCFNINGLLLYTVWTK